MNQSLLLRKTIFLLKNGVGLPLKKSHFLLLIAFCLFSLFGFAQQQITGRVVSGDTAIVGATVTVKGTTVDTQTDGNGNYSGIANHPAIQKRWAEQKEKLLTEYTGEVMERYLYECEQTIMDQTLTEKVMLNDLFIKALFANGIYTQYNSDYTGKSTSAFPVLPHKMPVAYAIDLKLDKYLNADGLVYIEQQGKACDERSAADLEAGLPVASSDEKVAGDFVAKYFLEPVSNQMIALYQKCSLSLNQERVVMSSINKIERTISS